LEQKILKLIREELEKLDPENSQAMDKISRRIYPILPGENDQLIETFDYLVSRGDWSLFWLVTTWIKKKKVFQLEYIPYYEKWLHNYIKSWGQCDVFCYRVLNPMVEKYPRLFSKVLEWTESSGTYVRRAAPVSLLESGRSFRVNYPLEKVMLVVESLKNDPEYHVQKGVGWLLKYAYLSYPEEIYLYLKNNVNDLPRVLFRYALEKTPREVREELMKL